MGIEHPAFTPKEQKTSKLLMDLGVDLKNAETYLKVALCQQ